MLLFCSRRTCSESYTSSTEASVNNYLGVIFSIFKSLNIHVLKSTMGVVDPLKFPSSNSMTYSENLNFNPNYFNRYHPNIISYLLLVESSMSHFHVTTFVALSVGKVKSTYLS